MLQTIILCTVLLTALLFDFWKSKIPNVLIAIGYLAGALYFFMTDSLWYFRVTDSLLILLILYPFFWIGAFGGGDVKLLTVIALFLGFEPTLQTSVLAVIIGAFISVLKILYHILTQKEFKFSGLYIHFSLPILLGTCISQFLGGTFLWEMF